jgi:hypothetical protein
VTLERDGDTTSDPVKELGDRIVTLADPLLVESDCNAAVTITEVWLETEFGAV